jgi:hypothetical protein
MTLSFQPFNNDSDPFDENEQRHVRRHDSNLGVSRE